MSRLRAHQLSHKLVSRTHRCQDLPGDHEASPCSLRLDIYYIYTYMRVGEGQAEKERKDRISCILCVIYIYRGARQGDLLEYSRGEREGVEKRALRDSASSRAQGPKSENRVGQWHPRKGIRAAGRTAGRSGAGYIPLWIRESGPFHI